MYNNPRHIYLARGTILRYTGGGEAYIKPGTLMRVENIYKTASGFIRTDVVEIPTVPRTWPIWITRISNTRLYHMFDVLEDRTKTGMPYKGDV